MNLPATGPVGWCDRGRRASRADKSALTGGVAQGRHACDERGGARSDARADRPEARLRLYATDFGERTFGIGDVLVGRERAHGRVNGDLYTLAGHRDDGRLELVRLRDEERVTWDLHEHRAIDHGYATTPYRSQGRTVDSVFALASSAEARRGLYVDVVARQGPRIPHASAAAGQAPYSDLGTRRQVGHCAECRGARAAGAVPARRGATSRRMASIDEHVVGCCRADRPGNRYRGSGPSR